MVMRAQNPDLPCGSGAKGTGRRKREREEHIRHILDVAESLFAERGFFRTTMKEIAREAEFALGTIYSYFRSKKLLYEQVLVRKVSDLAEHLKGSMRAATSPQAQVENFIRTKLQFLRNNLAFLRLYLGTIEMPELKGESLLPASVRKAYESVLGALTEAIHRGVQDGVFYAEDPKHLAMMLDSLTDALALSWLKRRQRRPSLEADARMAIQLVLCGVIAPHKRALLLQGGQQGSQS